MNQLRTILGLLLLLLGLEVHAQQTPDEALVDYQQRVGDHAALYRGRLLRTNYKAGWFTHPFLVDELFHEGEVSFRGVLYKHIPMRYDIREQELQIHSLHSDRVIIIDRAGVDWFAFEGQTFLPCQEGFARQYYTGRYLRLEEHVSKVRDHEVLVDGRSYNNLKQHEVLVLHTSQGDFNVRNLKDMQKLFPQYKAQLDDYSRSHNLQFKKEARYSSLSALAKHLEECMEQDMARPDMSLSPRGESLNLLSIGKKHLPLTSLLPEKVMTASPVSVALSAAEGAEDTALSLPAYNAYREGNMDRPVFAEETENASRQAGISELKPAKEVRTLDEVEITSFYSKVDNLQVGAEKFRPSLLRNLPMSMGESDIMKMVLTLPGVSTVGEASSGFNVRGGASDQNLILWGNNTIYNPMHMFGLFSALNTDAIGEVELFKSSIPSQYGGRSSSVMYMQNRMGSKQKWGGSVSLGLITSKAQLDLPLVKDKLSLMLAGRTTYSDWMLKKLPKESGYRNGKAGFYDMNGVLSWNVNDNHVVNLSGYYSRDRFSFTSFDHYGYSNANGSLEWKGYWGDNLSTAIQVGMDHYDYSRDDKEVPTMASRLSFRIDQAFFKGLFTQKKDERHTLKYGWDAILYGVNPGEIQPYDMFSHIAPDTLDRQTALQMAFFAEEEWRPVENLRLTGGLRYSLYHSFQKEMQQTYQSPELRLSAAYSLPHHQSVKVGGGNLAQFIHKVSNTVIMSPTDTWTLSNAQIKPQRGWQLTGGYYWSSEQSRYEISAEAYYKRLSRYPTYGNSAQLIMNHELHNDLIEAQGKAYGVELQVKKNNGKLTGWISYAYARTFLRQHGGDVAAPINDGRWYPAEYDHPHELNVVTNLKFTKRYSMSVNVDYSTGRPTTVPAGLYYDYKRLQYLPYYTERNGYRQPDNFRMDVSFNFEPSHHQTLRTHSWFTIGCYNVTGHRNVYSLYYKPNGFTIQGYRLSIFGAPIPYVSYNIKF